MLGAGATFSVVMSAFRYANGLRGTSSVETDEEEVERRENAKKFRRRPISETIEQLGEGRDKHFGNLSQCMTDHYRHLRSGLRREEATAFDGQVRH